MKKIAFYGGSFDPPHNGHLTIARKLIEVFELDEFAFIPAFHAPHKKEKKPTSAFHRFAMLCLATQNEKKIKVSTIELDAPEKPFTFETQEKLKGELTGTTLFFVIGADSWSEINTWREWEKVLTLTNIIVVTRPGYEISFAHVTEKIRRSVEDLRGEKSPMTGNESGIFITDAVNLNVSATEVRRKIRTGEEDWCELVPQQVAKYVEKYDIY